MTASHSIDSNLIRTIFNDHDQYIYQNDVNPSNRLQKRNQLQSVDEPNSHSDLTKKYCELAEYAHSNADKIIIMTFKEMIVYFRNAFRERQEIKATLEVKFPIVTIGYPNNKIGFITSASLLGLLARFGTKKETLEPSVYLYTFYQESLNDKDILT